MPDSFDVRTMLATLLDGYVLPEFDSVSTRRFFERVTCADGFSVSVQASEGNYCSPRNNDGPWTSVECGFPTEKDAVLEAWAENPNADLTEDGKVETVYGWVPSQVILGIIESHGGMVSGELPELIDDPDHQGE